MKKLFLLGSLMLSVWRPALAEELKLEGKGVFHYRYPKNFVEHRRYLRKGTRTPDGDCEFITTIRRMKPGRHIYVKELAYNPYTCESLMVEGARTGKAEKK